MSPRAAKANENASPSVLCRHEPHCCRRRRCWEWNAGDIDMEDVSSHPLPQLKSGPSCPLSRPCCKFAPCSREVRSRDAWDGVLVVEGEDALRGGDMRIVAAQMRGLRGEVVKVALVITQARNGASCEAMTFDFSRKQEASKQLKQEMEPLVKQWLLFLKKARIKQAALADEKRSFL
ncbi:hypothetical protein SETIT_5G323700v2 [Setaria italica]|uniref:Uncharacterized protein n=1 Tax=Setaria italica TaxID=4555 RepID=A0A368RB37_SETIT|nr:hypothetical protein SETIT_5G323700v2 [Setaria italica]